METACKKILTVEERFEALRMLNEEKSEREVANYFKVGKGTIN